MNIARNPKNIKIAPPPLVVSAVRYEAPVGKPYKYKNGEVVKGANYRPEYAVGEPHAFQSFEVLSSWRKGLTSEFMLTSGTFDTIGEVAVVYKGAEESGKVSGRKGKDDIEAWSNGKDRASTSR